MPVAVTRDVQTNRGLPPASFATNRVKGSKVVRPRSGLVVSNSNKITTIQKRPYSASPIISDALQAAHEVLEGLDGGWPRQTRPRPVSAKSAVRCASQKSKISSDIGQSRSSPALQRRKRLGSAVTHPPPQGLPTARSRSRTPKMSPRFKSKGSRGTIDGYGLNVISEEEWQSRKPNPDLMQPTQASIFTPGTIMSGIMPSPPKSELFFNLGVSPRSPSYEPKLPESMGSRSPSQKEKSSAMASPWDSPVANYTRCPSVGESIELMPSLDHRMPKLSHPSPLSAPCEGDSPIPKVTKRLPEGQLSNHPHNSLDPHHRRKSIDPIQQRSANSSPNYSRGPPSPHPVWAEEEDVDNDEMVLDKVRQRELQTMLDESETELKVQLEALRQSFNEPLPFLGVSLGPKGDEDPTFVEHEEPENGRRRSSGTSTGTMGLRRQRSLKLLQRFNSKGSLHSEKPAIRVSTEPDMADQLLGDESYDSKSASKLEVGVNTEDDPKKPEDLSSKPLIGPIAEEKYQVHGLKAKASDKTTDDDTEAPYYSQVSSDGYITDSDTDHGGSRDAEPKRKLIRCEPSPIDYMKMMPQDAMLNSAKKHAQYEYRGMPICQHASVPPCQCASTSHMRDAMAQRAEDLGKEESRDPFLILAQEEDSMRRTLKHDEQTTMEALAQGFERAVTGCLSDALLMAMAHQLDILYVEGTRDIYDSERAGRRLINARVSATKPSKGRIPRPSSVPSPRVLAPMLEPFPLETSPIRETPALCGQGPSLPSPGGPSSPSSDYRVPILMSGTPYYPPGVLVGE